MTGRAFAIPLSRLRYGHEAEPPINVRQVGRESEIGALAASILAHGLIHRLEVQTRESGIYVADGNRRLAALLHLRDAGRIPADWLVECDEVENDRDAAEISLAANVMRTALHPADEYVAFADLARHGLDAVEIGRRFGIQPTRVRKILAIGSLAPAVLAAWRAGAFEDDGINVVAAFSLAESHEHQERVLANFPAGRQIYAYSVRHQLGVSDQATLRNLKIVGREAYRAAGGRMIEDLFGDQHVIQDSELLQRLVEEKVAEACRRLVADGWAWAEPEWQLPRGARYGWATVEPDPVRGHRAEKARHAELEERRLAGTAEDEEIEELRSLGMALKLAAYSKEKRAGAGVILSIDRGVIDYVPGKLKPEAKLTPDDGEVGDDEGSEPARGISNALHERLSRQLTEALGEALADEPTVALAALLAGFVTTSWDKPIKVTVNGSASRGLSKGESFAAAFERILAMRMDDRLGLAAAIAGEAVDVVRSNKSDAPLQEEGIGRLARAIDGERLTMALLSRFDATDYFKSVPRALILAALKEAGLAGEGDQKAAKMGKPELVAFAAAALVERGWLPPELRTVHYAGPGAIQ